MSTYLIRRALSRFVTWEAAAAHLRDAAKRTAARHPEPKP